jgi:RNA ligase (TIGR02306 family)
MDATDPHGSVWIDGRDEEREMSEVMTRRETARRLATVETISEIAPIPDADAIVRARVRGWDVVVKKGEFEPGDACVYFEVDSMLDVEDERFAFLAPRGVRTDADGRKGHVLRTAKLRGQYSQGLALPLSAFPELASAVPGDDVTEAIGVWKWEPPIPAELSGQVRGMRPSWIPATDEERIQNLAAILHCPGVWVATEKLDGSSMTVYVDPDTNVGPIHGVCSRNLDLLPAESNTLWRLAREHTLHDRIREEFPGRHAAIQGEAYGAGIQGNPLKLKDQRFAAFTLRVDGREIPRGDWPAWLRELSVPVRGEFEFPATLDQALADADGMKSAVSPDRLGEGLVWRAADRTQVQLADGSLVRASFKVISNKFLLKHQDAA